MIPCWAEGSGFRLTQTPDGRQKRLDDLYEYGKKKGTLTYKEIMERLMDLYICLLYTSPSPRDYAASRMPSSA